MPRHLISDAHEWINEIPTVPIYYLAKPQPRERAWQNQRGKKTLNHARVKFVRGQQQERLQGVCYLLVKKSMGASVCLRLEQARQCEYSSGKTTWNGEGLGACTKLIPWRAAAQQPS